MKYILFISIILYSYSIKADIITDNPKGNIGEIISVSIKINKELLDSLSNNNKINISSSFEISNPTIFYPDSIIETSNNLKGNLIRQNDSLYSFSFNQINIDKILNDTLILIIYGELLAGNDTITSIDFKQFKINDKQYPTFSSIIHSNSIGTPLPYVRISTLDQNYPNPVYTGSITKWSFRIDKESVVFLEVYNLLCQNIVKINFGIMPPGNYTYELPISTDYNAGSYFMLLKTILNTDMKKFIVIK